MKKLFLLVFASILSGASLLAQTRYLDPVFTDVTVQKNVIYGSNFQVASYLFGLAKNSQRQPLACDVYTPTGDTAKSRPIAIVLATGNFLPGAVVNRPTGSKSDSSVVELCTRLAKMGYIAVGADYRLGWGPTASTQLARTYTLINAAYRGLQDLRSCIRYFKANGSTFGIDSNRVVVMGYGTGGYVTLGLSADAYSKIVTTQFPQGKFAVPVSATASIPMVRESENGDIEAKSFGFAVDSTVNPISSKFWKAGDTLCVPNTILPSSKYQLAVNFGGAVGDLTWVDKNSPPIISIQTPNDPFAPYTSYVLSVPIGGGNTLPVVEVQGSYLIQKKLDSLGTTDPWKKLTAAADPYRSLVAPRNLAFNPTVGTPGYQLAAIAPPGLFPIMGRFINDSGPWDWWDFSNATGGNDSTNISGNGNMLAARTKFPLAADNVKATLEAGRTAKLYIDTLVKFVAPRACITLNLPCKSLVTGTQDFLANDTKLAIYPNPSFASVTFQSEVSNRMQTIELYDLSGRSVRVISNINNDTYTINREGLAQGMYIAKVQFEGGLLTRKLVFQD